MAEKSYWERDEEGISDADFDNIYSDAARESFLDDDMLTVQEEAFMRGYEEETSSGYS